MKVVFHDDFYQVYTGDPAAASGRMEAIVKNIEPHVEFVPAVPALRRHIAAAHSEMHIQHVENQGLYEIAALAAGGAIQAAQIGLTEPCFGLIRPPGHHASMSSAWGFCYFNNMVVALKVLQQQHKIESACVLDIDLHFGDGTVNILGKESWATVINVEAHSRTHYLQEVEEALNNCRADLIGISAGFDNHAADWGGLLSTEDYEKIGYRVRKAADSIGGSCFAILEGGYNHDVLGENVLAMIQGMTGR
ncbi:MAG: histone deacetylase family protein [Deltaproteobacteria bacterium]|nr:histone deacetylase family protein [Deltaproteobacteria bacterium]